MRKVQALVLLFSLLLAGCPDDRDNPQTQPPLLPDTSPPAVVPPSAVASASALTVSSAAPAASADKPKKKDLDQRCPPADPSLKPLKLVKFQLTSGVDDKRRPKDSLEEVRPGMKVWAYLTIRNLSGQDDRCVTVAFEVGDKHRSRVTLDIGQSPGWRTWATTTITDADVPGQLGVVVMDDQGNTLVDERFPLRRR